MAFTAGYSTLHDFGAGEHIYGFGVVGTRVIAVAYSKLFYSDDAGATWTQGATRSNTGTTDDRVVAVDGALYLQNGLSGGVQKTTDGVSLTALTGVTRVFGGGGGVLFGLHSGASKRSLDGGASWSAITVPGAILTPESGAGIHGDGATFVGVSTSGGVYRSVDAGLTFTQAVANDSVPLYGFYWSPSRSQFVRIRDDGVLVSQTGLSGTWTALGVGAFDPWTLTMLAGEAFDVFVQRSNGRLLPLAPADTVLASLSPNWAAKFGTYAGAGRFILGNVYNDNTFDDVSSGVVVATVTSDTPLASPNDNFSTPIALVGTSGTVTGNTVGDTVQAGEPSGAVNTVWYSVTPGANKTLTLDTTGSFAGVVAQVFSGSAVNALTAVPLGTGYSLTGGTTYYVRVGGASGGGDISLAWALADPPAGSANDDFADAIALAGASGSATGNAAFDTIEAGEPAEGYVASVWYSYVGAGSYVKFAVTDPSEEVIPNLFTGGSVASLTPVDRTDYYDTGVVSAAARLEVGTTYALQLAVEPWVAPPTPTTTGFTLAWESCDRFPAPVAPNRYVILSDALTGDGPLSSAAPAALWPTWGAWLDNAGVARTAAGAALTASTSFGLPIVHELLADVAFDVQVFAKFTKQEGSSPYGIVTLWFHNGFVELWLRDYGDGPEYALSIYRAGGFSTTYVVPLGFTPPPSEFVELRMRVGRGKVELVRGYSTLVSEAWDGLSGFVESPAKSARVVLGGVNLNVFKDLTVIASTVDLPPVEPPVPPDGPFWGGFINTTETLQVL